MKLRFLKGNAKLSKDIWTFSLPAGHSCPFAKLCLSKANQVSGRIKDGAKATFRCYAASNEALLPNVRQSRWRNYNLLKACKSLDAMVALLLKSLPRKATTIRIHASGDFFNQMYFDAWLRVATAKPNVRFYGYTKALPYWVNRLGSVPTNLILTASYGGSHDHLIKQYQLKHTVVVFSPSEAKRQQLAIDKDDSKARNPAVKRFALLLHGVQPAGTTASASWQRLKGTMNGGYVGERGQHLSHYQTEVAVA